MTRFGSSANQTEAARPNIRMAVAVDLDFASGHVRHHDGIGSITILGNTYTGLGHFGSIDLIDESTEVIARPLKMRLSGVDASIVATALDEVYQNRSATVYLCLIDQSTNLLMDDPEIAWEGRMDTMRITLGEKDGSIELNCEHRLRREPRVARYTDADQNIAYSGDRFFDLIAKISGFAGTWGSKSVSNDLNKSNDRYQKYGKGHFIVGRRG